MNKAQETLAMRGRQRLQRVSHLVDPEKRLLDHGPARYEEAETLGRGLGEGSLVATNKKLIFHGDATGQIIVMPYTAIDLTSTRGRLLTCDLAAKMRGGDVLVFNGGRTLLASLRSCAHA